MIWIDWCIVAFFVISILIGVIQGFVREVLNLLVWVLAFGLASVFGHMLADMMIPHINEPAVRLVCAYLVLFISGLVLGSILSHLITELVRNSIFSGVDRSLGAGFGFLRGALVVTVFLLCAGTVSAQQAIPQTDPTTQTSGAPLSGGLLQEVIVTAEKRAQPLQDVPMSITAVTSAALQNLGATTLADIARA
ncbi:MAG: CvpA family protein, partial [Stenotrophobium sp.]